MIEKLIKISKREVIPEIDVTDRVIRVIRFSKRLENRSNKPLKWTAIISSIAASVIMFFSLQYYIDRHDPMFNIIYGYEQQAVESYNIEMSIYAGLK